MGVEFPNSVAVGATAVEQTIDGSSVAKSEAQPQLLSQPLDGMIMSDDVIAQITGMLAKAYRQDRKEAKKLAQLENKNFAQEVRNRVAELHEKAEEIGKAALVSGFTQMAAGAVQIFGASSALWAAGDSSRDWQLGCEGGAGLLKGTGEVGSGIYREAGEHCEANAAQHDGNAEAAKRRGDEYRAEADDAKRMLDKVAEFLKSIRDSQQSSASAALYKG